MILVRRGSSDRTPAAKPQIPRGFSIYDFYSKTTKARHQAGVVLSIIRSRDAFLNLKDAYTQLRDDCHKFQKYKSINVGDLVRTVDSLEIGKIAECAKEIEAIEGMISKIHDDAEYRLQKVLGLR